MIRPTVMQKYVPLISIIVAAISIRILYSYYQPSIKLSSDSYEYANYAKNIFYHPSLKLLIQPYRTPVYPLIILGTQILTHSVGADIGTGAFQRSMNILMIIQIVLFGTAACMLFYRLCSQVTLPGTLSYFLTLFFATGMTFVPWERVLLTESLAMLWALSSATVLVRCIRKPKPIHYIHLTLLTWIGFYIRPSLIIFSGLSLVTLLLYRRRLPAIRWIVASGCVIFLFLGIHIYINRALWGYNGLIMIGDTNLFGKILEYNLPIDSARDHTFFYSRLTEYRARQGVPNPYRFYDTYDPDISINMGRLADLRSFTLTVLAHNIPRYLYESFIRIPRAIADTSDIISIPFHESGLLQNILAALQQMAVRVHAVSLLSLVIFPVALVRFFRKISPQEAAGSALGLVALPYVYAMVLFGYEDLGRLIVEVVPILLIFTAYWLSRVYRILFPTGISPEKPLPHYL